MIARVLPYYLLLSTLFAALSADVLGADAVRLFEADDNRSRVSHAAYAYYPDKAELRVRLTLQNRQVKSGRYQDAEVIRHFLSLLSDSGREIFCTYEGNAILAVYTEQKH